MYSSVNVVIWLNLNCKLFATKCDIGAWYRNIPARQRLVRRRRLSVAEDHILVNHRRPDGFVVQQLLSVWHDIRLVTDACDVGSDFKAFHSAFNLIAVSQIVQYIPEVRTFAIDEIRVICHLRQRVTPDEHHGQRRFNVMYACPPMSWRMQVSADLSLYSNVIHIRKRVKTMFFCRLWQRRRDQNRKSPRFWWRHTSSPADHPCSLRCKCGGLTKQC